MQMGGVLLSDRTAVPTCPLGGGNVNVGRSAGASGLARVHRCLAGPLVATPRRPSLYPVLFPMV